VVPDAHEQDHRERADRPVRAVLQIDVVGQGALAHQEHGERAHEHGADEAKAQRDQDRVGGDRERADHAVEGERGVQHLEVEEQEEAGLAGRLGHLGGPAIAGLHRLRLGLLRGLVVRTTLLEEVTQPVHQQVGRQPQAARGEHHGRVLGQRAAQHHQHDDGQQHRQPVELPDARQRALQPAQPGDLPALEEPVQEEHEQEHAAERGDLRVGLVEQVGVRRRIVGRALLQRQGQRLHRVQPGRHRHDDQREHQAHPEHRDQDADGQEDPLPEGAHPVQHGGVDHRVVERQRDLEDAQDRAEDETLHAGVEEGDHQRHRGDGVGPAKDPKVHVPVSCVERPPIGCATVSRRDNCRGGTRTGYPGPSSLSLPVVRYPRGERTQTTHSSAW
jgi:hypothetical protein